MQGQSPSDVIKPEVRRLSAYTLKHVKADVKLDQNENPYELPQELKEEVARRVLARPWGRYPEFVPHSTTQALSKFTGWTRRRHPYRKRLERTHHGRPVGDPGKGAQSCNSSADVHALQVAVVCF